MSRPGAFKPGPDPRRNAGGRPKQDETVMEILRAAAPAAARRLVLLSEKAKDEGLRQRACEAILNRVMGTPRQQVEMMGDGVTFVMRLPKPSDGAEDWEQEAAKLNGRTV